jgi:dTDP-4-dehydrorhamnose reductase
MKIIVLGANGLIGSTIFKALSGCSQFEVFGTVRSAVDLSIFENDLRNKLFAGIDVKSDSYLINILLRVRPSIIINCIGLTKHRKECNDIISALSINSLFPHKVFQFSQMIDARFIHISSDCVFSGLRGNYLETDLPDASDLYGRSKALGEVVAGKALTLRTSTIGHEINTRHGLLEWFLDQTGSCKGFKKAIFSGIPTISLAHIIKDYVIPNEALTGLYHVSASPINKFDLLNLVAKVYNKKINIQADEDFQVDRSLNATKFNLATGYVSPDWDSLIRAMRKYQ